jgi:hypothetical protein
MFLLSSFLHDNIRLLSEGACMRVFFKLGSRIVLCWLCLVFGALHGCGTATMFGFLCARTAAHKAAMFRKVVMQSVNLYFGLLQSWCRPFCTSSSPPAPAQQVSTFGAASLPNYGNAIASMMSLLHCSS